MQNLRKNSTTLIVIIATIVLAGIAVFTAIRLYQLKQTSVAPNAPVSNPAAAAACGTGLNCQAGILTGGTQCVSNASLVYCCPSGQTIVNGVCTAASPVACTALAFSITIPTGTGTATATPTSSPTNTPTSTPAPSGQPNSCNGSCGSDSNCQSGMFCYIASGTSGFCRNPNCSTSTSCTCSTATAAPTTTPTLPTVGSTAPTILGISAAAILLVLSFALIL